MPKIKITENDYTGRINSTAITHTVYVPCKGENNVAAEPELFTSVSKFEASGKYSVDTLSYKLIKRLLNLGLYVLAEAVKIESDKPVSNTKTDTIDWARLEDKSLYDIRFLTTGEFACPTGEMCACAQRRGDCVALLDHPESLTAGTYEGAFAYKLLEAEPGDWSVNYDKYYVVNYIQLSGDEAPKFEMGKYYEYVEAEDVYVLLDAKPETWDTGYASYYVVGTAPYKKNSNSTFKAGQIYAKQDELNVVESVRTYFQSVSGSADDSFSAAFTPWFKSQNADLGGSSLVPASIPAAFGYLFAYARSIARNPEWYAVAGSFRGNIAELNDVHYIYTAAEIEMLQARGAEEEVELDAEGDNIGFAINPISYVRPFGYIIWGNRTLIPNAGSTKSTSFLNVRNLVSSIKKSLYNAARKFTFEQNNDVLWVNFKSQITPLLDKMQSGNGIVGYKFTRLETDAKARLKARLTIIPIEAVEDFELEIELADSISTTETI